METLKKESHQIFLRELKLMKSKQKQKEIIAIQSIQKDKSGLLDAVVSFSD